jgi:hypothetical protein
LKVAVHKTAAELGAANAMHAGARFRLHDGRDRGVKPLPLAHHAPRISLFGDSQKRIRLPNGSTVSSKSKDRQLN